MHAVDAYEEVEVQGHAFLTTALNGGEWLASQSGWLSPEKGPPVPTGQENRCASKPI